MSVNIMNIFEQESLIKSELENRAREVVKIAANAIMGICNGKGEDLIPEFVSYRSSTIQVVPYVNYEWVDNPYYVPNETNEFYSRPENQANQAGFHKIRQHKNMCTIYLTEEIDTWDDAEPDHWTIDSMPQELFLNGSPEEIEQFVIDKHKAEVERKVRNDFQNKWSTLFYGYTPDELRQAAEAMIKVRDTPPDQTWNSNIFERFLDLIKEDNSNDANP